jgi:hypothetical protein
MRERKTAKEQTQQAVEGYEQWVGERAKGTEYLEGLKNIPWIPS